MEAKIIEIKQVKAMLEDREDEIEKLYDEKKDTDLALNKASQEKKMLLSEKESLNSTLKDREWKIKELERSLEKSSFERKDMADAGKKAIL